MTFALQQRGLAAHRQNRASTNQLARRMNSTDLMYGPSRMTTFLPPLFRKVLQHPFWEPGVYSDWGKPRARRDSASLCLQDALQTHAILLIRHALPFCNRCQLSCKSCLALLLLVDDTSTSRHEEYACSLLVYNAGTLRHTARQYGNLSN